MLYDRFQAGINCNALIEFGDDKSFLFGHSGGGIVFDTGASGQAGASVPLVLQMLAVGKDSGNLSELLSKVADYDEREVDYATDRPSSVIGPVLAMVIGGLVPVIAMGTFLPMWGLASVDLH